ncbi:NAD(P)H-dependent oxidoreductase [Balneatrix alpica]|uniref:NAD(P)H-dependent oxidoreductase n=1 Tax=Balneatrix alpica TaxID=75684 RepID=UPI00273A3E05|nr:NAD(P)H-dependent oxidoreductase [Balneatrix alpica]
MKKILLLNGNPKSASFASLLSDTYHIEAREQAEVRRFNLTEMDFNPSLEQGYDAIQPLEPCLLQWQQALQWADHLVIITPIWWGGLPAKLKGLLDRTLLPGFAFQYDGNSAVPTPLLGGKSARLLLTMDAPADYAAEQAAPVLAQLDRFSLQFCGIGPAEVNLFGSVILSDETQRQQWLAEVQALGRAGA